MTWTFWDGLSFALFLVAVVGVSLYASRRGDSEEDYFLAGRGLTWPLIGFSLIASNISTEHFVGMAGSSFGQAGLAVASYEWLGAVVLVFVALVLLPRFLRLGIYTMPEFLEHRYGVIPRTIMAVYMLAAYVGVAIAAVLYSGAIGLEAIFGFDLTFSIWLIGGLAGAYRHWRHDGVWFGDGEVRHGRMAGRRDPKHLGESAHRARRFHPADNVPDADDVQRRRRAGGAAGGDADGRHARRQRADIFDRGDAGGVVVLYRTV